jgi:hypothetical protein
MSSASFRRLATVTASTKRPPAINATTGLRGAPTVQIASLMCLPLDPVDPAIQQRLGLHTPHEVLSTVVDDGLDIVEGDILVVSGKEYPIKAVGDWAWRSTTYRVLYVENLKR